MSEARRGKVNRTHAHWSVGLSYIGPFANVLHQAQVVEKSHHHTGSISEENATRQVSIKSLVFLWVQAVSPRAGALRSHTLLGAILCKAQRAFSNLRSIQICKCLHVYMRNLCVCV